MTTLFLCWSLVLASIRGQMQYRASFLMQVASGIVFQCMGFVFVWLLLSRFRALDGWTIEEMALLYGIRLCAHGAYLVLFNNMYGIDQMVQGEFDRFLVRPLPILTQLMFSQFRLSILGDLTGGIVILGAAISRTDINWTPANGLLLVTAILGGGMIDGAMQLAMASTSFRTLNSWPLRVLADDIAANFANYPISIFGNPVRFVLTFLLPIAFMAYLPAAALLGKATFLPAWCGWLGLPVGLLFLSTAVRIFLRMTRTYQSTGS